MNKHAQAALEFLTTYAWAFLGILIVVSAISYFGFFNFGKFLPETCTFTSQLQCTEFVFDTSPTNEVRIKLINNLGEEINVDNTDGYDPFVITSNSDPPLSCTDPANIIAWVAGESKNIVFTGCTGGNYVSKERVEAKVTLTYYAPDTNPGNSPRHAVTGRLDGKVQ